MADGNLALRYKEAENDYRIAKSEYERKQALAAEKIVSEADLRSAEARMQQAELLYHAFEGGELTLPQYLVESDYFFEAYDLRLQTLRDLHLVTAEMNA